MGEVTRTLNPTRNERHKRDLLFFLVVGLGEGATVIAFAVLPQSQVAALAFPGLLWVVMLVTRLSRRFWSSPSPRRMSGRAIAYLVAVGVVLVGTGVVVWIVVRNGDGPLWLAWTIASLVFAVMASGAWIVGERSTDKTTPAL